MGEKGRRPKNSRRGEWEGEGTREPPADHREKVCLADFGRGPENPILCAAVSF